MEEEKVEETKEQELGVTNELMQEKLDQIEILQDNLQKEKEKLHALQKQYADLHEEF